MAIAIVFAVPDSPLAQPRNVIGGNLIGAFACIFLVQLFGAEPWVMALAVATAIKLMQMTRTLHPPSGAIALVGVISGVSWDFLLTPVLAGSIVMVVCTFLFNNLTLGRSYPKHWLYTVCCSIVRLPQMHSQIRRRIGSFSYPSSRRSRL